jgi:HEAT repeat protein
VPARAACPPPSARAIAAERREDLRALRVRDGSLRPEPLSAAERDDLAYFLAAVHDAGKEITTVGDEFPDQVRARIDGEERAGRCAVAERLLGIDEDHGPHALNKSGFDVARLYRGALLTANRDGAEDWEQRVRALEGLADVAQRAALPALFAELGVGLPRVRVRALSALGKLLEKPDSDPCSSMGGLGLHGSSRPWQRSIGALGRACATKVSPAEAAAFSRRILPSLSDADPEVRRAAAEALGAIASPEASAALEKAMDDPYQTPGQRCTQGSDGKPTNCRANHPVREAAGEALRRIRQP